MLQKDHLLEWRNIYKNLTLGLEIQHKLDKHHLSIIDDLLKTTHDLTKLYNLLLSKADIFDFRIYNEIPTIIMFVILYAMLVKANLV